MTLVFSPIHTPTLSPEGTPALSQKLAFTLTQVPEERLILVFAFAPIDIPDDA